MKTSDAKLFLIKLQTDGKRHSTVKTVRGVLRPAFQMAVDDDYLNKNPFGFQLAGVVVNDSVTRQAITRDQMRKFLKFVHDDNVYCKYYEAVYILFHTGMPEVAMHWEHRFNHMVKRYNEIYRVQMPPITPHVCRHTYTHLGLEDTAAEMNRMQEMEEARREQEKLRGTGEEKETVKRQMFKVI